MSSRQDKTSTPPPSKLSGPVTDQISSSSYTYPVRSLLGRVQPAADHINVGLFMEGEVPHPSDTALGLNLRGGQSQVNLPTEDSLSSEWEKVDDRARQAYQRRKSFEYFKSRDSKSTLRRSQSAISSVDLVSTQEVSPAAVEATVASNHRSGHSQDKRSLPSDFRHFPAVNNEGLARSFSVPNSYFVSPCPSMIDEQSPDSIPRVTPPLETTVDVQQATQIPNIVADAPADATIHSPKDSQHLPFNPSEYGIVHLPPSPMPLSVGGKQRRSSTSSEMQAGHNRSTRPPSLRLSDTPDPADEARDSPLSLSNAEDAVEAQAPGSCDSSSSLVLSAVLPEAQSVSDNEPSSAEPIVTIRYEHVVDNDGHAVMVGREGKLTRCEDEPIRIPGAVQAFGVLIAVDEGTNPGTLVVRQVSENALWLLGLSPRYLFSLECFTDTFPEDQADLIWDTIQFLHEPNSESDEQEDSPHVFLLSGWGEPGSAGPGDRDSEGGKRSWTCWCAVHRPYGINNAGEGSDHKNAGLLIFEFELERDTFNPLYPPVPMESSGAAPPTDTVGSHPTDGSDRTLVSSSLGSATGVLASPSSEEQLNPSAGGTATASGTESTLTSSWSTTPNKLDGLQGDDNWVPSTEAILESTTSRAKPLPALERLRRMSSTTPSSTRNRPAGKRTRRTERRVASSGVGMMDVFAVMGQINEQFGAASDLDMFLKIVVGVIKDLTQFHRVLIYQFDESWNGQTVAELADWSQTHDLYKGLHFPASDIPAQARELYTINKVRLLYDRSQPTARLVVRTKEDLDPPLDMTHCYLRAMSPIHIKYLANMAVRASMSLSIVAFGSLWGLVACHSYGSHGMRVSFPVRQMLRLLSQSISRNIERLSYAQRLHTRKLINTITSEHHPTGYIVSNVDDLLGLFDADFGILVIGEAAKLLGPNQHGQEILIMAEYLRLKQFNTIHVSQAVARDFPDLDISLSLEAVAGLLYVPLSSGGKDFIAFLRKGQLRDVHWAGKPYKDSAEPLSQLEPRKSFKMWTEKVAGRCRAWTDEQMETAGVLALVYGKFIEVWRQKENAVQTTKLTNLLLSNASHEVRTPLNHIINYLEMALDGPLDLDTRHNLSRSHAASKGLLFTINDLLDLTRLESGNETSFNEPFNLQLTIEEAVHLYRKEADRRNIAFKLDTHEGPKMVVGDASKIRTVVANLTANALKYTTTGEISVTSRTFGEPEGLRGPHQTAVEIVVSDTGCGIANDKLQSIFREFEQVECSGLKPGSGPGLGLGLAVVARIVEQLGGQLRVDSKKDEGSRFSLLVPLALNSDGGSDKSFSPLSSGRASVHVRTRTSSSSGKSKIDDLVKAISRNHMNDHNPSPGGSQSRESPKCIPGTFEVTDSNVPLRPVKIDEFSGDGEGMIKPEPRKSPVRRVSAPETQSSGDELFKLRILIVEDNDINRLILAKRLSLDGHTVVKTTNGQEGLDKVESDREFDCVLMDIQMPILNGFEATERIRALEKSETRPGTPVRRSQVLNGRIPIFAVSASLTEAQRNELLERGMDGWILKPIDFKRLSILLRGIVKPSQRNRDVYRQGYNWESGGWFRKPAKRPTPHEPSSAVIRTQPAP